MRKVFILFCFVLLLFGCGKKEDGKVLATIDGEKITLEEFNKELDRIPANMKMLVLTQSGKQSFLDRYVVKRLLMEEAKKANIEKDKDFQDRLSDIREQLLIETLLKKKVATNINPSEQELQDYYEKNKEKFKTGQEVDTRQILVKTEKEAREIRAKLDKGEDFADLAKRYSIDPSAKATGGEIGFHAKGTLVPEYEAVAFKLTKVGQISAPVKTQLGYHIIQLQGIKPPAYTPYEEVKEFIKQRIAQERQNEVLEKYVTDLKSKAKITVNAEMLKSDSEKAGSAPKVESPAQTVPAEKVTESVPKSNNPPKAEPAAKLEPQAAKEGSGEKK
ncbi:MAG TPA: peptidyl-prolyl cis-trans isomerase [Syntrophorhabdales bacterium]|nr:peptidyl-prolyl cis-trans isomerase [Syntrophorhabdales bacterium]